MSLLPSIHPTVLTQTSHSIVTYAFVHVKPAASHAAEATGPLVNHLQPSALSTEY
jgi:hypothetical protein